MAIKYKISLGESERSKLEEVIKKDKSTALQTKPSYVLLAAQDENLSNESIALTYHVGLLFVEKLRKRFVDEGFETALQGKKWGGHKKPIFDGSVEAHLIAYRCANPPAGHTSWSLRLLAQQMVVLDS
ncbi:MAG: helix-turn-helix domain-containing protein [Verrucomicrobia bacterium]|nr:helix-turn-helix domain-containing protein [Cytophagales bacterium]